MTGVAGALEQHVLGFPGVGTAGPGHSPAGRYRVPAMGRHGKVSPGPWEAVKGSSGCT